MSSNVFGNPHLTHFDVLVIGSGAGGGTVAHGLVQGGLSVLVLEAGPNRFLHLDDPSQVPVPLYSNDELKNTIRSFVMPDPLVEPRSFRASAAEGDRSFVGDVNSLPKTVGGGAVHADLKMARFEAQDFQLGTRLGNVPGASFADWPVAYDALEPFYVFAERNLGVQGQAGANPFESPRSAPYPMPPGVTMFGSTVLAKGLRELPSPRNPKESYTPFPYPSAVNSRPYDGRPACVDCGFCGGFGCPSNAKGSPAVTLLRKALLSGRCQLVTETRAVRLLTNGSKNEITGVVALGPDGERVTYTADRYVLASSPVEDARLLLLSDPDGLGNGSGQVGRNVMFHFQTVALGIFEQRMHGYRGRADDSGFADYRGVAGDPSRPLGGIVEIGAPEFLLTEVQSYLQGFAVTAGFDGAFLKNLMRQSPLRDRVVVFTMHGEDAPQSSNVVDLDPAVRDLDGLSVARVTYGHHRFELSARTFYSQKMLEVFGKAGARYSILAPPDAVPSSRHVMGTLRFGADPRTSVCDETGRFHGVGNLYVADGALFPTASGFNPTLTIVALSTWVAGNMVHPGAPQRILGV